MPPPNPQQNSQKLSVDDFATKIKSKYPVYANVDNKTLTQKIVSKYPQYGNSVDMGNESQGGHDSFLGKVLGGIGGFIKSATSPVATMLARPIQAGAELLGASAEDVNRVTKNLTGDYVAPVPENFSDVKKDIGRGAETIALGLNPVAGGALYGAGNSVEQGNDIFSGKTALQATLGAAGGKALDVAAPILGKFGNAVTPKIAKDVGGVIGDAVKPLTDKVGGFMEKTKILPDNVSTAVNKGADIVNDIPDKIGNTIKNQFGAGEGETRQDALNMVQKVFGSTGKKSAGVLNNEGKKMLKGAETLVDNAPTIKVTDDTGNLVTYNPSTATPIQHIEALSNGKKATWASLEDSLQKATGEGIAVDSTPTTDYLQSILNSKGRIAEHSRAQELYSQISQLHSPTEVNDFLVNLNAGNQAVANGTSQAVNKKLDYEITRKLEENLDKSIIDIADDSSAIRKLKDTYSGYKSVENSLVNLAKKSINKKDSVLGGGLMDYANSYNLGEIFQHLASGNLPAAGVSAVKTAVLNKVKGNQTPEAMLNRLFATISKYKGVSQAISKPTRGVLSDVLKNTTIGAMSKGAFPPPPLMMR